MNLNIIEVLKEVAIEIDGLKCNADFSCCIEEIEHARNIVLMKIEKISVGCDCKVMPFSGKKVSYCSNCGIKICNNCSSGDKCFECRFDIKR